MQESTVVALFEGSSSIVHLADRDVSMAEVAEDGRALAQVLTTKGLEVGDRIALWAKNGLPYLQMIAAAAAGRFVLVSVNTRFQADEAFDIVRRSGASMLVTDQSTEQSPESVDVVPITEIEALVHAGRGHGGSGEPSPDDPFIVFTTSGTTSKPKLVVHRQRSIADHNQAIPRRFGLTTDSRVLVALPLCGVFGLNSLLGTAAADSEIWLPEGFDAEEVAATIERNRVTHINGSDDMFHRLLTAGRDLSSIEVAGYGRFNTSLDGIVQRADDVGVTLTGIYGMSEVQALYSLRDPSESVAGRERAGGARTSPEAAARIVDPENGAVLPEGTDGELHLRGPSLFAGYLAEGGAIIDDALTERAHLVDDDGARWFRTGDLARSEPDGTFTYLTRMGDVLRLGGFLVNPSEIEDVLMNVDGITAAQVVAVPRPDGVRPVAFVITNQPIDELAVIDHCHRHLALFKSPIRVIEIDAFPSTPSANGTKIQRSKLRELAIDALAEGAVR